jgi:hypothetical protein
MATLFLGMIEPGKCGRHEHTGDQLLLVNADSAAKSGFAFYRVDVQCDMLNLSWMDSKVDSKKERRRRGFPDWFTVHFAVKPHGFGWT